MDIFLHNGISIPAIGFGTWQIPEGKTTYNSVLAALEYGYRHIDTAMAYANEKSVGRAIRDFGLNRNEIFVTTKLPAEIKGYKQAEEAFYRSLSNLGLDYIDLYLIHAPKPWGITSDGMEYMDENIGSWQAMEELYQRGKIRSIGVSNFEPKHLDILIAGTNILPMINQINIHPTFIPSKNIKYCRDKGIAIEGYSPLGTGRILDHPILKEIAAKYNRSVAQICIRWSYQNKYLPLPKSITPSRIKENFNIFDFEITNKDMIKINKLTNK